MKRNVMHKNLRQSILKSLGRYIAIVLIIALGAGMFVGLLTTKSDMIATAQEFTDDMNMFHLRLLNTYGWTAEDVASIEKMAGVAQAEGSVSLDVLGHFADADESAYRLHTIPKDINQVNLLAGRMPSSSDECLMDGFHADESLLGTKFTVSAGNDADTLENLSQHTFTVVGYVSTPLYMDMSRGSTTIGNGNLSSYLYIPSESVTMDYFTEIFITMESSHPIYSDELNQAMEQLAEKLEPEITVLAQHRFEAVKQEAQAEYDSGMQKYEDGLAEFENKRQEALEALDKALTELQNAQSEIDSNRSSLADSEAELQKGQNELNEKVTGLEEARQELIDIESQTYRDLSDAFANLLDKEKEITDALDQVNASLAPLIENIGKLESQLSDLDNQLAQLENDIASVDMKIQLAEAKLMLANAFGSQDVIQELEKTLEQLYEQRDTYPDQKNNLKQQREELVAQIGQIKPQQTALLATQSSLNEAMDDLEDGYAEWEQGRTQAAQKFSDTEKQLNDAQLELDAAQAELDAGWAELNAAKAELQTAQDQLDDSWAEYETSKADTEQELADAEAELANAKTELEDGKKTLESMAEPDVYLLDRNTNIGYLAVNNNSDIVAGVSRVFPAFFLLVAALVCITTMTRMIEEERTQIGILKALGYDNRAIINKYLIYAGSAAIIGCGLGVLAGSVVFPLILWEAYSILLNVRPNVALGLDIPLCIAVVVAYTAVSLLVTWYCCRRSLREVPAELMRPKAPTPGKKIFMEHLPFWKKISFLNKVMFRNVFRYRQRLLMMLVGIGGCTALLLTGFGIRDSIVDIVSYQYAEITTYDLEVHFTDAQTPQEQMAFRGTLTHDVEDILFFYQASGDLEFEDSTKEITLIASDEQLTNFIKMENDDETISMPAPGEACVTIGVAEAMDIGVGDTILVRDAELRPLELRVSGIFTNYVHNYVITSPQTLQDQWGELPGYQMAYITVNDSQDAHTASAKINGMEDVLNVTVCQDTADQVGSMLDALDMVVVTVVVCAVLLAAIVLYNLTNISITERIREIATIKVLGFNAKESALYVFKENLFLSGLGSIVGLGGGILLLKFVMSQIKVDMVWMTARLKPMSFVWSVVLTMVCTCIVDIFLYFKLEKINMAEALKSVE